MFKSNGITPTFFLFQFQYVIALRTLCRHFTILPVFGGIFGNGHCLVVCFSPIIILCYKPFHSRVDNKCKCASILVSSSRLCNVASSNGCYGNSLFHCMNIYYSRLSGNVASRNANSNGCSQSYHKTAGYISL